MELKLNICVSGLANSPTYNCTKWNWNFKYKVDPVAFYPSYNCTKWNWNYTWSKYVGDDGAHL